MRCAQRWSVGVALVVPSLAGCVPAECYDHESRFGQAGSAPSPPTALQPGETRSVHLRAASPENPTGIQVEPGVTLEVRVQDGRVCDWMNPSGAQGRPSGMNPLLHLSEGQRVEPQADWMEVVARVNQQDTVVGQGPATVRSDAGGELMLLVNDVKGFYGNNRGGFVVEVRRP